MATTRASMSPMMMGKGKPKAPEKKGMGFKAAASSIAAKEDMPMKQAGAVLASSTRKASNGAKAKNPNLKKVK